MKAIAWRVAQGLLFSLIRIRFCSRGIFARAYFQKTRDSRCNAMVQLTSDGRILEAKKMNLDDCDGRLGVCKGLSKLAKLCGIKWRPQNETFERFVRLRPGHLCTANCSGCWFGVWQLPHHVSRKIEFPICVSPCERRRGHSGIHLCYECREDAKRLLADARKEDLQMCPPVEWLAT